MTNSRNLRRLERQLERFYRQIRNPVKANREISIKLYQFVIRNFQAEGELVGGWADLKPATIREKRSMGYTKKLVRTGQLKNSFVPFFDRQNAGVRSELSYASDHQFGVPSRNLPAREMLPSKEQTTEIGIEIYNKYIQRQRDGFSS